MKNKEFLMDLLNNIIANIASSAIMSVVSILLGVFLILFGSKIVALALIVIGCVIWYKKFMFTKANFYWTHIYDEDIHTYTLKTNKKFEHTEKITVLKKNKKFNNKIKGYFDWDDVNVNSIDFSIDGHANVKCVAIESGNKQTYEGTSIDFSNVNISRLDYEIEFQQDTKKEVLITVEGEYKKQPDPSFYIDIKRPIKKLNVDIKTTSGVKINNVQKKVTPLYGAIKNDKDTVEEGNIEGTKAGGNTTYTFPKKNPRLLHKYGVSWKWM